MIRDRWAGVVDGRRRRRQVGLMPDLLEIVARELRAGRNLHDALAAAAHDPITADAGLMAVLARTTAGEGLAGALDGWAVAIGHPDADLLRAVLTLGADTGGAMARSFERAAETLRERAALRDEVRALTTQARISALMLAVAPLAFLSLVLGAAPSTVGVMLGTPAGRLALCLGLVLDAIGFWWMQRLVAGAQA